jgi:hypothetical protein
MSAKGGKRTLDVRGFRLVIESGDIPDETHRYGRVATLGFPLLELFLESGATFSDEVAPSLEVTEVS